MLPRLRPLPAAMATLRSSELARKLIGRWYEALLAPFTGAGGPSEVLQAACKLPASRLLQGLLQARFSAHETPPQL